MIWIEANGYFRFTEKEATYLNQIYQNFCQASATKIKKEINKSKIAVYI